VTREGKRLIAVLTAVVLAIGLLAACGDSDSASTAGEAGSEGRKAGETNRFGEPPGASPEEEETAFSPSDPADVETPLKVSGGGSEQFIVKGGDNSIPEFGEEADEDELEEVAEIVHSFYVDRASGNWSGACSYMAKSLQEQLQQLASKSEVRGCAPFLEAFTTKQPDAVWKELTTVDAASLRHDDEQAFLIYRGAKGVVYAMPLREEAGEWKVGALAGTPIG
jgi:hypothetical protein